MLDTIPEVYAGITEDPEKDFRYWTYLLFENLNGNPGSFDLLRIDNTMETMEVLGREIPYPMCHAIIEKHEPGGVKPIVPFTFPRESIV